KKIVNSHVTAFYALDANLVFLRLADGNIWKEHVGKDRQLVAIVDASRQQNIPPPTNDPHVTTWSDGSWRGSDGSYFDKPHNEYTTPGNTTFSFDTKDVNGGTYIIHLGTDMYPPPENQPAKDLGPDVDEAEPDHSDNSGEHGDNSGDNSGEHGD